ncbi:hypothetical protein WA026_014289 [Henosepilachna vigintioctopunctata]|uniref:Uncharacterized protein n=1 Tax=Henosepilachna vigintioctopunctata TaxID=420089 RepID=A0AAW1TUQ2_9CUCU
MLSQKYLKKSSSNSSFDSGVGFSVKNKSTVNSHRSEANFNQHFLQVANSTIEKPLLKKGLMDFNESCQFMPKATPVKMECSSDSENATSSQFSPLACSTQQLKKSEFTSVSSNNNKYDIKRKSSSESDEDTLTPNKIKTEFKQRARGNTKSGKKSKINILENHLIQSDWTELDSDSYLSVVEVRKPVLSYSLCSNIDSEEEIMKSQPKNIIQDIKAVEINKIQKSPDRQKKLKKYQNRHSISMNSEEDEMDINECLSHDVVSEISKPVTSPNKLTATENDDAKSSQQGCNSSSSDSESSESISCNQRHSHAIEATIRHKNPTNFVNGIEGYEKLKNMKNLELGSDDEVYLLQLPKTINPKIMEGISFSLSKKSKLKLGSEKYCIRPQSHNSNLILTSTNTMRTIRPLATLKMEKHQKLKKPEEVVYVESKKQPLPNSIKIRHPLFGAEYQSKIELEKQIKDKLEEACQRFNLKQRKSRKIEKTGIDNELTSKRKKKHGEFEIKQEVFNHEEFEPKKMFPKKNKEHKREIKIKEEIPSIEELELTNIPLKKKKKKKESERTIEEFSIKTEPFEEHFPKSKKQRRKSIFSSTGFLENLDISSFKDDVSKIEPEEPVIKKSESCNAIVNRNENADLINRLLLSAKVKLECSNNKKKSKRK